MEKKATTKQVKEVKVNQVPAPINKEATPHQDPIKGLTKEVEGILAKYKTISDSKSKEARKLRRILRKMGQGISKIKKGIKPIKPVKTEAQMIKGLKKNIKSK